MAKLIKLDETRTGEIMYAYDRNTPLWETIKEIEKETYILKLEVIIDNEQKPIGYLKIKPNLQIKKNNEFVLTENPVTLNTKSVKTIQQEIPNKELPIAEKENLLLKKLDDQLTKNLKNIEIQEFNKTINENSVTENTDKLVNPFALPKPTIFIPQNAEENWDEEETTAKSYPKTTQIEKPAKDQTPTITEEREEDDKTRIFCFVQLDSTDEEFYNDFKQFGPIDYIYTTLDKSKKVKLGYIRYLEVKDAEKAIQQAKYYYKTKPALPQRKYENENIQKQTFHTQCKRNVTTRYFSIHEKICEKQRNEFSMMQSKQNEAQTNTHSDEDIQFEKIDKTKIPKLSVVYPTFTYDTTTPRNLPTRQPITLRNIDYNSGKTIGEAKRIILDHEAPVIIDENASRSRDPFNGILWDNAKFIDAPEPMSITQTKLNELSDKNLADLISYLELMRSNRDKAKPADNLITLEKDQ